MGRDEVPPDPTVPDRPGVSFALGQASSLKYEGTDSSVRKSFPCLEVSDHFDLAAHLTEAKQGNSIVWMPVFQNSCWLGQKPP